MLTLERLEELQADALADDIPIDLQRMSLWTEDEVTAFFESGGETEPVERAEEPAPAAPPAAEPAPAAAPAPALDPMLAELIGEEGLGHLLSSSGALLALTYEELCQVLDAGGRAALLSKLKASGVSVLGERQRLAGAIGKARRDNRAPGGASALPPGALRRKRFGPLPPFRRLSAAEIKANVPRSAAGEWFRMEFPINFEQLLSDRYGAPWLTRAFHAAGTLPPGNRVAEISACSELPLQGDDAQGGAGIKAILTVRYEEADPSLHETLFVKMPFLLEVNETWRGILSSQASRGPRGAVHTHACIHAMRGEA